jgi:hypothetical protein
MKVNIAAVNKLIKDRNKNVLKWRTYLKKMKITNGYEKMELIPWIKVDHMDSKEVRELLSDLMVTGSPFDIEGSSREEVIRDMTDMGFYPNSLCGHYAMYDHPDIEEVSKEGDSDWYQTIMCDNEHGCEGCNIVVMAEHLVEADWDKHVLKFSEEQLAIIDRTSGVDTLYDFEWDYRDSGTLWLKKGDQVIEITECALQDLMDSWRENN